MDLWYAVKMAVVTVFMARVVWVSGKIDVIAGLA